MKKHYSFDLGLIWSYLGKRQWMNAMKSYNPRYLRGLSQVARHKMEQERQQTIDDIRRQDAEFEQMLADNPRLRQLWEQVQNNQIELSFDDVKRILNDNN